ncbi:MAG: ATP-binding cassette domain-containing protein, partial [Sphingomonadales bacterium]
SHFEDFSASVLEAEEKAGERLKQHLKAELHWLARGVTARRKRNQGRLRKLEQLRNAKRNQEAPTGRAALNLERGESSGKLVAEVEHISKSYDGRTIINDFSTRILRGDRIGIIGANGSGKSTLVGLLTGRITPDEGKVKLGTKLDIAHIDQRRVDLADDLTVADILSGGGDFIDVRGEKKHVAGYLKEFLFDPAQLRSPVQSLSGGERNRLLMAKAFAKQVNLVVLDEPTNDLDMDTLDLLEEVLADFDGTVILVSHDRDFLDRVVTSIIALDGKGGWSEHVGGYSDWEQEATPREKPKAAKPKKAVSRQKSQSKLSYKDARALELLPKEMAALEAEMSKLETRLGEADFYSRDPDGFAQVTETLEKLRKDLQDKEEAWLELELKKEELEGG